MTRTKEQILEMKQKSAKKALEYVKDNIVLGVGSGSTVREFIKAINNSKIDSTTIHCIPSSLDTEKMLIENEMNVGVLNQYPKIDLTIDGADRVDSKLNIIKGGGAALLREKIIAAAADEVVIIVDDTKIVDNLGGSFPVPVEVIPHAIEFVRGKLMELGGNPTIRKASDKLGPTITDNGNVILDTDFSKISDPTELEVQINNIPGVMENGLFPRQLISKVIIASIEKIEIKERGK